MFPCPRACLRIWSRETVRVQPSRPASACSSPYSGWIWCLLTGLLPSSAAASIYLFKPTYAIGSVPSLSGHAIAYRWRSLPRVRRHRASKPQDSSERVQPWQVTMNQLIFASLSHTHYYWYEVVIDYIMLKVPAEYYYKPILLCTKNVFVLFLSGVPAWRLM